MTKFMVAEYTSQSDRENFYTDIERRRFQHTLRPPGPEGQQWIWLAHNVSGKPGLVTSQDLAWTVDHAPGVEVREYAAAIAVEQLVFLLFAHRWTKNLSRSNTVSWPIDFHDATIEIWPATERQVWPPPEGFGWESFTYFLDHWLKTEPITGKPEPNG
jgi:hypothetical protein